MGNKEHQQYEMASACGTTRVAVIGLEKTYLMEGRGNNTDLWTP